jgi:hypothetical protein
MPASGEGALGHLAGWQSGPDIADFDGFFGLLACNFACNP